MPQKFDIEAARKSGASEEDIVNYLAKTRKFDVAGATKAGASISDIANHMSQMGSVESTPQQMNIPPAGMKAPIPKGLQSTSLDKELDKAFNEMDKAAAARDNLAYPIARAAVVGFSGLATGMAASPFVSPAGGVLAGSATMSVVDKALRMIEGNKETSLPLTSWLGNKPTGNPGIDIPNDVIENTLATELISKPIDKILGSLSNVLKEADATSGGKGQQAVAKIRDTILSLLNSKTKVGKGSVTGEISKLKSPLSGYPGAPRISGPVETLFAPGTKKEAIVRSTREITKNAEKELQQLTGTKIDLSDLESQTLQLQKNAKETFDRITPEANARYAETIGIANRDNLQTYTSPTKGNIDVTGPVMPTRVVQVAQDLKTKAYKTQGAIDQNDPFIRDLDSIIEKNSEGLPISFQDAWTSKQDFAKKGYNTNEYGDVVKNPDVRYREISKAYDEDIQNSIQTIWNPTTKDKALKNYQTGNKIVGKRHEVYLPEGETGLDTKDLLRGNKPDPAINTIMYNENKLQRFLETGDLKVPGVQISTTNNRREAQGYMFSKIFKESHDLIDKETPALGEKLNNAKLLTSWNEYKNSKAGKLLFGDPTGINTTSQRISELFDAYSHISAQQAAGPNKYLAIRLGASAAYVAGNLLTGQGIPMAGATLLSGAVGLHAIGKLMANENSARLIMASVKQAPLNMSREMASKIIGRALKGETIDLMYSNGNHVNGIFDANGNVTPQK